MRAGLLGRARITISRKSATQNTYGEDVITWTALGTYWANIRSLPGRARPGEGLEFSNQTLEQARFKIDMRYQRGIAFQRKDRILWGTRILDVKDVEDPDQRQRRLFITATEDQV